MPRCLHNAGGLANHPCLFNDLSLMSWTWGAVWGCSGGSGGDGTVGGELHLAWLESPEGRSISEMPLLFLFLFRGGGGFALPLHAHSHDLTSPLL